MAAEEPVSGWSERATCPPRQTGMGSWSPTRKDSGKIMVGLRPAGMPAGPREAQIAKLARDGHTNQQIATQLFISPHTVEWHLGNVFTKLGITSRKDLR